jgi:putative ABC transport system ATP-binding protein
MIQVRQLYKTYRNGNQEIKALDGVSLDIHEGEFVAIMGASGSGKSTFMNIAGCLDRPTSGSFILNGTDVSTLSRDRLAEIRNREIGFVFQGFNLLPRTTALENVELPLVYRGLPRRRRRRMALEALEQVGLLGRVGHRPNELSGGQQQRVAIARALVTRPPVLLADEPTGNLDSKTTLEVMELLERLVETEKITLVLVTHEDDIAARAHRVISVRDGRIEADSLRAPPPLPPRAGGDDRHP